MRKFTAYPSNYVRANSRYTDDSINQEREYRYQSYLNNEQWEAKRIDEGELPTKNDSNTGYWKAIMRYYPEDGGRMQEYFAFTTGYDKDEAKFNLYDDDLEQCDWHDECFTLTPISEEEYKDGIRRYNDGERWR